MATYNKKVSVGEYAKKDIDYKNNDMLTIANEGKTVEGQFGTQTVFLFKLPSGEEKNINVNQTSLNAFIDAFGTDSVNWVGKQVRVQLITQNVAGKFVKVAYIAHPDAELGEDGFTMKGKNDVKASDIKSHDVIGF